MPVVCPGIHASARNSIRSRTALGRRLFGATLLTAASLLVVPAAQAAHRVLAQLGAPLAREQHVLRHQANCMAQ